MTHQTSVAAMFAGMPAAMSWHHAGGLLETPLPQAAGAGQTGIGPGERYVVSRGVATVPVRGLLTPNSYLLERFLGWTTYHGLEASMDELAASEDVSAIVLHCDSPGGLVLGTSGAGAAVARAAAVKPVHALVHPLAASAAYWLASQATDITITPGSFVGNIGVVSTHVVPVQPGMSGAQAFVITSSHARAKRPDPTTEAGMAEIRRSVDALEAEFHAAVAAGRGIPVDQLPERLSVSEDEADGGADFWGQEAITRGLADRLQTSEAFWTRIGTAYAPKPPRRSARAAMAMARAAQATARL